MPGAGASRERNGSALLRNFRDLLLVVMDLIEIYQCFCDRTRLRILNLLTRSPLCVCHFQDILGEPQIKNFQTPRYLRSRGMVALKRDRARSDVRWSNLQSVDEPGTIAWTCPDLGPFATCLDLPPRSSCRCLVCCAVLSLYAGIRILLG
jgi:DNA-binding transcriptional ArsR family regulator